METNQSIAGAYQSFRNCYRLFAGNYRSIPQSYRSIGRCYCHFGTLDPSIESATLMIAPIFSCEIPSTFRKLPPISSLHPHRQACKTPCLLAYQVSIVD